MKINDNDCRIFQDVILTFPKLLGAIFKNNYNENAETCM